MSAVPRHARFQPTESILRKFEEVCTAEDGRQWATVAWVEFRGCQCVLERRKRRGGDKWVIRFEIRDDMGNPRQADQRDLHALMKSRNNFINHGDRALERVEESERKMREEADKHYFDRVQNDLPSQIKSHKQLKFDMGGKGNANGGVDSSKQRWCLHGEVFQQCPLCNYESRPQVFRMNEKSGDGTNGKFVLRDHRRKFV